MSKKPLEGIRVLDFTNALAGPYCSMMLGNMGAEVIKVEKPGTGDDARGYGPFVNGQSGYFVSVNHGKKSVVCNTKDPEGVEMFKDLVKHVDIVVENLKAGAYLRKDKDGIEQDIKWVYELFPRLEERNWQLAGTLSGGEQQMLAVGRALMSRPKLMMMDEPSLGLAPLIVRDIFQIIREINKQGVTILLIEQNANMALKIADYAYVLETGCITKSGTGAALLADESIKEAYLGKRR